MPVQWSPAMVFLPALLLAAASVVTPQAQNIVELAQSVPTLSILVTAVVAANLTGILSSPGPFTVFAPNNAAFQKLPAAALANLLKPANVKELTRVLEVHVISGAAIFAKDLHDGDVLGPTVNGVQLSVDIVGTFVFIGSPGTNASRVIAADNVASNGVVHIVDTVLLPVSGPAPVTMNIVELAQAVPTLSTLVKLLVATNSLVDVLSGPGPFTVFAPNNAAFDNLPPGVLELILEPASFKELSEILEIHVIEGTFKAKDLKNGQTLKTVNDGVLTVTKGLLGKISIASPGTNASVVIAANNAASNGVVHIVDTVLLPTAPDTNKLWFRGFTKQGDAYRCGEVNAGPRMPKSLFEPYAVYELKEYEDVTIQLFPLPGGGKLELGRCSDKMYNVVWPSPASVTVDWAPPALMGAICLSKCECNYRNEYPISKQTCIDEPDKTDDNRWCSLCGPKFNQPIEINYFACGEATCPGPGQ